MKRKVLCILMALTVLFSLIVVSVSAEIVDSGTCGDNLTWTLDDNGTLTISGTGDMRDNPFGFDSPWYITAVVIGSGVTSIGDDAFAFLHNLTSIIIPDSVTSIGDRAFSSCGVTSIIIPDSVTSIGDYAFSPCISLTSITIPDSVTSIGYCAFTWSVELTTIDVSENNAYYSSDNGVLFDKNKTTLICCPGGKTGSCTIPDSVISIEANAFHGCISLTSVIIPDSVRSIGDYAFFSCTDLTDVYYGGSEEDWEKITIGAYNEDLQNANIHFNAITEPEKPTGEYVIGDLNGDGKVTALDNIILARHLAGWKGYETLPYLK